MANNKIMAAMFASALTLSTLASGAGYKVPTNGLIGHWPGDGTAADTSPVGNNGSFDGIYSPGPTGGQAFNLATTNKVTIPNNPVYNFRNYAGWSVGFWFNANGATIIESNGLFLGQDIGASFNPKWFIDYGYNGESNSCSCYNFHVNDYNGFNTGELIFVSSQPEPAPAGWNHLTVTINNTNNGTVSFYLNGQSIGTGLWGGYVPEIETNIVFGQAEGFSFSGLMSEVVIYSRMLSTNEIWQLATAPFYITSENLDGNGNIVITWQSLPGGTYQVLGATNLATPVNWTNVGSPVIATSTNTSATIPITPSGNFFRVSSP